MQHVKVAINIKIRQYKGKSRDKNSLNTKSVERRKNEKMQNLLFNYIIYYTFYIFDIFI